jgi:hypothetical protein
LAPMAAIAELAVISAHYAVAALRVRRQYCYSSHGSPSKKPESPLAGLLAYHHVRRPGTWNPRSFSHATLRSTCWRQKPCGKPRRSLRVSIA